MIVVPDVIHDQPRFFPGAEHLAPRARDLVHRYVVDQGGIQGQLRRGLGASDAITATDLGAPERPRRAAVVLRVEISDVCLMLGRALEVPPRRLGRE